MSDPNMPKTPLPKSNPVGQDDMYRWKSLTKPVQTDMTDREVAVAIVDAFVRTRDCKTKDMIKSGATIENAITAAKMIIEAFPSG